MSYTDRFFTNSEIELLFTKHASSKLLIIDNKISDQNISDKISDIIYSDSIKNQSSITQQSSNGKDSSIDISMFSYKWSSPESLKFFYQNYTTTRK